MVQHFSTNDSGFETSVAGWSTGTSTPTVTRDSGRGHTGTSSLKAVSISTAAASVFAPVTTIVPNSVYVTSYWAFTTAASMTAWVAVDWKNSGSFVSSGTTSTAVTLTANTWTLISICNTAPASGVNQAVMIVGFDPLVSGDTLWVDDANLSTTQWTYTSTGTWTCPTGVSSVQVECWAGGGAGGGGGILSSAGGGAAGGSYSKANGLGVVATTGYTVTVGAGGVRSATISSTATAASGGDSWFNTTGTVIAKGGAGGQNVVTAISGAAGSGSTTGCVGDVKFAGGNGAAGVSATAGGGGGGGAGSTAVGGNASTSTAGTGGNFFGGAGSAGTSGADAVTASTRGGGGGGGRATSATDVLGGTGGAGAVVITELPTVPSYLAKRPTTSSVLDAPSLNISTTVTSTTGNTLVAVIGMNIYYGAVTVTGVTDSASNVWTRGPHINTGGSGADQPGIEIWYCINATAVTSVTAAYSGTPASSNQTIIELTRPVTAADTNATTSTATATAIAQSIANAGNNEITITAAISTAQSGVNNANSAYGGSATAYVVPTLETRYPGNTLAASVINLIVSQHAAPGTYDEGFSQSSTTNNHQTAVLNLITTVNSCGMLSG